MDIFDKMDISRQNGMFEMPGVFCFQARFLLCCKSYRLCKTYQRAYTARMDESKKTYEVLDAVADQRTPMPRLSPKKDGFSRQDVVDAFQNAFTMIGGVQRLALWANANPDKFYPLYARMMPSTSIQFGDSTNVQIIHALAPTELDRHPDGRDGPDSGGGGQVEDGRRAQVRDLPQPSPVQTGAESSGRGTDSYGLEES